MAKPAAVGLVLPGMGSRNPANPSLPNTTVLPALRDELRLCPASPGADGAPRWRFHDPLRARFYLLGDSDVQLLSLWRCANVGALRQALAATGSALDEAQLNGLLEFLTQHHLVQAAPDGGDRKLHDAARQAQASGLRWLLQQYMGMRFVLWRPQAFLQRSLPLLAAWWCWPVLLAWGLATGLGLLLVARQWDSFVNTFANFLSPGGLLGYGVALGGLKVLHELGHAYAAAHHGCRVHSMGISVAMGMPMLYTDTSDTSRLDQPRQRVWVAAGGVLAETAVAGLATLGWAVLPDGSARSVAFVLATSSWLMSLAVNLNPLSRFDGYYALSDALGIDNLQTRAVAYAGWAAGRAVLGPVQSPPEALPRRLATGFVLYGSAVWCYRIGLYSGLAALAYAGLFKLAGLVVGLLALWLLVATPLLRQAGRWWQLRQRVSRQRRISLGCGLLGGLLLLGLPLDRSVAVPALLAWQDETVLQAPENAQVLQVLVRPGQAVKAGDVLLRLASPDLRLKQATARIHRSVAEQRLDRISGDAQDRADTTVLAQQRNEADADLQGLDSRSALLLLRAPRDGVVVDLPEHLQAGQWVRPDLPLLRLLHGQALDVRGFVAERALPRLQLGAAARFVPDDPARPSLQVVLQAIDPTASEQISPPVLSSLHGGPIATQADSKGRELPLVAQHRIRFVLRETSLKPVTTLPTTLQGEVRVDAQPQSLLQQAGRQLWRLLMAELRD